MAFAWDLRALWWKWLYSSTLHPPNGTLLHFHHHLCCEDSRIKRFGLRSNQVEQLLSGALTSSHVTPKQWNEVCELVTEASQKFVGSNSRDSFIRTTLLSRSSMPGFSSKSYFKVLKETKGKLMTIFYCELKFYTIRNNFLFQGKFVNFL
ncbi:hypothetical protein AVEN_264889-1 [Araneus ventricosus]|uniref:Uncharacterized protein n=1 Tax=Araneus ventricosus TaxID=182803 RepID=A0A4Y2IN18_ARAVE|nr:hypothetical protein AVEN_264889-1 [Araneus ventricosus]